MLRDKGGGREVDESVLQWSGHIKRRGNGRSAKNEYMGECVGSCSVV